LLFTGSTGSLFRNVAPLNVTPSLHFQRQYYQVAGKW
jgi:hypothetical protein